MKTYKQLYESSLGDIQNLTGQLVQLRFEYHQLFTKEITILDAGLMKRVIKDLHDINKNGGGYSSAKAAELLWILGELK